MTQPTPSPMPTPDLGNLLRRPPKVDRSTMTAETPVVEQATAPSRPSTANPHRQSPPAAARTERATAAPPIDRPSVPARPPSSNIRAPKGRREYLRSIALYLPRSIHHQLKVTADEQGTTSTALILAAVNATHQHVGDALRVRAGGSASPGSDLFEIPQARKAEEPAVATTIRVTDAQLEAIKDLTIRHGANRSQLITEALRLHLAAMR